MKPALTNVLSDVKHIAVVGASPVEGKVGNVLLKNVLMNGFKGLVYAVNPKYSEVLGVPSYKSLGDLPLKPDLVVIAVPTEQAIKTLEEASTIGVKLAVVITSGFSEVGNEEAQQRLTDVVRSSSIRVIGPNSAGISLTKLNLHASIEVSPSKGRVGLAVQSGAVGGVIISELRRYSSGISFFISLGNMVDVELSEVFEYALEDSETEAVIAYVEWVKNGRRFLDLGGKLVRSGKPLVILKGGRGVRSSEAVKSHTGGLTTNYEVFKVAVKSMKAYLADDIYDAIEVCEILRRLRSLKPRRVFIVTNSGGLGVLTASSLEEVGIELPLLPSGDFPEGVRSGGKAYIANPLDLGGDSTIDEVIDVLTADSLSKYVDLAVLVYVPTAAEKPEKLSSALIKRFNEIKVPTISYFAGEGSFEVTKEVSKVMPVVTSSVNLAKALSALNSMWG